MLPQLSELTPRLEAILAANIADLTTEFRNYEAADLIALIRLDRVASLRSLLDGECDMLFKAGTMRFAGHGQVMAGWRGPPSVRLTMKFQHLGVEVYFRLTLKADDASVEIDLVRFDPAGEKAISRSAMLERALRASRTERQFERSSSFRQEM
jgi:hypothetical protein